MSQRAAPGPASPPREPPRARAEPARPGARAREATEAPAPAEASRSKRGPRARPRPNPTPPSPPSGPGTRLPGPAEKQLRRSRDPAGRARQDPEHTCAHTHGYTWAHAYTRAQPSPVQPGPAQAGPHHTRPAQSSTCQAQQAGAGARACHRGPPPAPPARPENRPGPERSQPVQGQGPGKRPRPQPQPKQARPQSAKKPRKVLRFVKESSPTSSQLRANFALQAR
jgi:hypothetical protein